MGDSSDGGAVSFSSTLPVNFGSNVHLPLFSSMRMPSMDSLVSNHGSIVSEDEYRFVEVSHPAQLLAGLNNLRKSRTFCDITICVDGKEFYCHKVILSSFSPYFKAMFAGNMAESFQDKISINCMEASMVELLLDFAYTSEILINKSNVQSLLSAANLFEVLTVKEACCHYLEQNMEESNCIGIHCFAEIHACDDLQQKSRDYLLQNFITVWQQEEFVHINQSKLVELLSDDDLVCDNEEVIFEAAASWLNFDIEKRKVDFDNVLECVRLPLTNPYFIHDYVESNTTIMQSEGCRRLVEEAKTFQLLKDRQCQFHNQRTRLRKSSVMTEVIVAVGGEDDKVVLRSVETLDPSTFQWKPLACLPFAVSKHGLVASGSTYLYLAGGEYPDGSASKSVWRYDSCIDCWEELSPMQVARSELGVAMLDWHMYAVGGWDGSSRLDSVEQYSVNTNTWTFVAAMKIALTSPAVAAMDGCLYVTGGAVLEDGDGIELVQCYNPRTDKWTDKSSMLIPRSGSGACVLNGFLYIIGGWHASTENTSKVECYDPRTDQWVQKSPLLERRYRPGVTVVSGKVYVLGGEEGWDRYHDTIECYDPDTDSWEIVGEMQSSRSWLSCVSLVLHKEVLNRDRHTHHCTV